MSNGLVFKAGPGAYRDIRDHGFSPAMIGSMAGASGGAKWLVLSQMDRVVLSKIVTTFERPVHMIGSSIGAWRFACYAQQDPVAAIERFERAYLEQRYSENPDRAEITSASRAILDDLLGERGPSDALAHPTLRLNVMTVRSRHITASERSPALAAGLLLAMTANAVHRRSLGGFFERGLFFDPRERPPFLDATGFTMHRIPLTPDNLAGAVMASGSIPMVLAGVRDIPGAPKGIYRDGGVIDYHLDLPTAEADRITFFPHFFDWLKPGWFDRQLGWRKVNPAHFDRTLLVCPSPEFIAGLPHAKVPDRQDFVRYTEAERVAVWTDVVERCRVLVDELDDVLEHNTLASRLQPL